MNSQSIKFGDKEVGKKDFCSARQAIPLHLVDTSEIIVSNV